MDDRLNHEQKMFSKTNWEFTKKIVEFVILKIYTKEVRHAFNGKWVV